MPETNNVWIKTTVLEKAITGHSKKETRRGLPTDEEDEFVDWGWAYATSKMDEKGAFEVTIQDEESPHHGITTRLPADSLSKNDIMMGNKYRDDDDYDDFDDDPDVYPDDLITLTHLHEAEVVHCLRNRYAIDKIYTATGPILLALNPFKNCKSLYSEKVMKEYWEKGEKTMKGIGDGANELSPHVYAIADSSFRTMMKTLEMQRRSGSSSSPRRSGSSSQKTSDQSILVSGESGAGKTVTTKFIMQYLATLSQRSNRSDDQSRSKRSSRSSRSSSSSESKSGGQNIEQQVLQSNPILESFGNARTIRNDNSSRFGKFIEIKFSSSGTLVGASIETYLLEKVRLISQADGERNYHIFYEVFCMSDDELDGFFMGGYNVEDFRMINQSGTYDRRDGVEDFDTYDDLRKAMETMGIPPEQQRDTLSIPCAALHASNMEFVAKSADESALDVDNPHLEPFTKLMGIKKEALEKAVCYLRIQAGKEFHTRTLSRAKAAKGMEAFIKAFYGALFSFLVNRINSSITVKDSRSRRSGRSSSSSGSKSSSSSSNPSIGVLDIFGFESFKLNSFEQLCINYCNEALQQQFNLFVLKNEQAEYDREGIEWSFIAFPDNQDVLDLIDKKGSGILAILDDQCRAPGTTDKTFCIDLYKKCTGHSRFEADFRQVGAQLFGVKHYAGPVEYNTEGFVEKNRDELPKEATDLLLSSSKGIVRELGRVIKSHAAGSAQSSSSSSSPNRRSGTSAKVTVGGQFSKQLHELRRKIDVTTPHYVRCLKPNDLLIPDHFNPLIISDQLRYAGVIEAVRVSRVGYPHRYSHSSFVSRYRILGLKALKKAQRASRRTKPVDVLVGKISTRLWKFQCEKEAANTEEEKKTDEPPNLISVGLQVGKTKVFLRRHAYEALEHMRGGTMAESAKCIQKIGRGYIHRRDYLDTRRKLIMVQCLVRMQDAKERVHELRLNYRATRIQTIFRRGEQRKNFLALKMVAKWMQRVQRGRSGRKIYNDLNRIRRAIVIQKYWRRYQLYRRYKTKQRSIVIIECAVRCWFARRVFRDLRLNARDLQAAVTERDGLKKETQKLQQQLKAAERALAKAENAARSTASSEELEAAKKEIKNLKHELKSTKTDVQKAKDGCEKEFKRAEAAEATVANLESRVAKSKADVQSLKAKVSKTSDEMKRIKASLSGKDKEIQSVQSKLQATEKAAYEITASEAAAREALTKELEATREELRIVRKDIECKSAESNRLSGENRKLQKALDEAKAAATAALAAAAADIEAAKVPEDNASAKELEEARKTIEKLEKKVKATRTHRDVSEVAEEYKRELKELKRSAKDAQDKAEVEIERLKQDLDETNKQCAELKEKTEDTGTADEILTLQDEIGRLNQELRHARKNTTKEEDPNSPEALVRRYSELRRLAEAGMEKDKQIEQLKTKVDELSGDAPPRELTHNSESESLGQYITELQKELQEVRSQLAGQDDGSRPNHSDKTRSFLARTREKGNKAEKQVQLQEELFDIEEKLADKDVEIEALREVNEMLRVDVEKSRKRMKELQDDLQDERERSRKELEAFGKTLRGVDELRLAAESMNIKLKSIQKRSSQKIQFLDEVVEEDQFEDTRHFEEATRIIDAARNDLESKEHKNKEKEKGPFWHLDFMPKLPNGQTAQDVTTSDYESTEEDIKKIMKAKAKRKKKKRRGSGSSIVSSFF